MGPNKTVIERILTLYFTGKQQQVNKRDGVARVLHNVSYKLGTRLTRDKTLKTWQHGTS